MCLSWLYALGVFDMKPGQSIRLQALGVFVMVICLGCVCHEDRYVSWLHALGVFVIFAGLGCVCHGCRPWVCLS